MTSLVYSTGTVSVSNGSATVIGAGTAWATALVKGGMFSCAGMAVPIEAVASDASLTLAYAWPGSDDVGAAYAIARGTSEAVRAAWTNDRLATVITRLSLVGIHPDGSGTLAERDALDPPLATGKFWLHAEVGVAFEFYRKTDSGWEGPFPVEGKGPEGPMGPIGPDGDITWEGAWLTGKPYLENEAVSSWGSSYVCVESHTAGTFATDLAAAKWELMAAKGDKGDTGDTGAPGADGAGTGDVVGPASATDGVVALFDGTTGKLLKAGQAIGNVDNTSDADKPISTATQTALDGKYATSNKATAANIRAATADKVVTPDGVLAAMDWVAITAGASPAVDHAASCNRTITHTANATMGAPSNAKPGWPLNIDITPGAFTTSWHANYKFGSGGAPSITARRIVHFICRDASTFVFLGLSEPN